MSTRSDGMTMPVKSQGQMDYEADVARKPTYHDGTPRPTWDRLWDAAKWSWERDSKRLDEQ